MSDPVAGPCGNSSPRLAVPGCSALTAPLCDLPAGHIGWHFDSTMGAKWGKPWSDMEGAVLMPYGDDFNELEDYSDQTESRYATTTWPAATAAVLITLFVIGGIVLVCLGCMGVFGNPTLVGK